MALPILINNKKLAGSSNNKVIIVFDGYATPDDSRLLREVNSDIKIIFSESESADERIREIAESAAGNKNVIIVSDDNEVKLCAKLFRIKHSSVQEFLKDTNKKTSKQKEEASDPGLNYSQVNSINQELRKLWLR